MHTYSRLKLAIYIFSILLLWGCVKKPVPVTNLKEGADLVGAKVLAGQMRCYNNDEQVPCYRGWRLFMMGETDDSPRPIVPDREGFIYIPVEEGKYTFPAYERSGGSRAKFDLNPYLEIEIEHDDEVVNFGVLEFRYQISTASKVSGFLIGTGRAYLKMEQKEEFEPTEALLRAKFNLAQNVIPRQMTLIQRPGPQK